MESFTFTLRTDCIKCGKSVPVNGPLRSITCDACYKKMKITPKYWAEQVACAFEGSRIMNYSYICLPTKIKNPHCANCEKTISSPNNYLGKDTTILCKHCGKSMHTFPTPRWLKKVLPSAVQIICSERESDSKSKKKSKLKVNEKSNKPIVFSCPNCSAALHIVSELERITPCEHCSSEVYIPDAIWNRLHPVRTISAWTIIYNAKKLKVKGQIY